jgi:hypothetical protein
VTLEGKGEVGQATRNNEANPTYPHWRAPAANHNWPTHIDSQDMKQRNKCENYASYQME